jgi:hypothetical protein
MISLLSSKLILLVGSPLGVSLGYFLLQHKNQLGNLYVAGMSVFWTIDNLQYPTVLFSIAPLP